MKPPNASERTVRWRFTLHPTPEQAQQLTALLGLRRFAYNTALRWRLNAEQARKDAIAAGIQPAEAPLLPKSTEMTAMWTELRNGRRHLTTTLPDGTTGTVDVGWIADLPAQPAQQAIQDLGKTWHRWNQAHMQRTPLPARKRSGRPTFRTKKDRRQSVRFVQTGFGLNAPAGTPDGKRPQHPTLRLSSVPGTIRLSQPARARQLARRAERGEVRLTSCTVIYEKGIWTASLCIHMPATTRSEQPDPGGVLSSPRHQPGTRVVGIDVGARTLASISNGTTIANLARHSRHAAFIADLQRHIERLTPGSRRHQALSNRLTRLHTRIARQRTHDLNTATRRLVENQDQPSVFVIEDLTLQQLTASGKGTPANPNMRRASRRGRNRTMRDAAPGEFLRQLTYKATNAGHQVLTAPRTYPSSKLCHRCGRRNNDLGASKTYICPPGEGCGGVWDRDLNAAYNLETYGRTVIAAQASAA